MVRFVHTADWQLGMRRHYLDAGAQERFAEDRREAVAAVGRLAGEVGADFVVVAGDAFEHNRVDRRTVLRALETLAGFPDVPVLVLPANHDPLDAGSVYRSADFERHRPAQVRVLSTAEPVELGGGAEIVGAPWTSKHPVEEPAAAALAALEPTPGRTRVLAAHGPCDALVADAGQPGLVRQTALEAAIADGRIAFAALGDRHSATPVGETGRIWYAGAPEPTDYDETDPGKALVVDLSGGDAAVEPHQVGRWTFRREVLEVAGPGDVDRVARWLDEPADKARTVAKLALRGQLSLRDRERLEQVLAEAAETYAALEGWQRHAELVTAPDEADLDALAASGFVRDAVDELRERAAGAGDDAETAGDAVALLHRVVRR